MEDLACPKCKTTVYRNPNMKLMVNVCGHNLCESCVELLFAKGSGSCPECGLAIRRVNFRPQLFEDASIDKEVDIRKRILKDFNKKEEDFETQREFHDYQEMVEDIIYNLANDLEILETNKQIAEYKEKNQAFIAKHRHRVSRETLELADLLSEEARLGNVRHREVEKLAVEAKKAKLINKEKLIDDLMFSDANAEDIVNQHKAVAEAVAEEEAAAARSRPTFSTGQAVNSGTALAAAAAAARGPVVEAKPYVFDPYTINYVGPEPPNKYEVKQKGYDKHVRRAGERDLPGGYHQSIACNRALQEAFAGLFFTPTQTATP